MFSDFSDVFQPRAANFLTASARQLLLLTVHPLFFTGFSTRCLCRMPNISVLLHNALNFDVLDGVILGFDFWSCDSCRYWTWTFFLRQSSSCTCHVSLFSVIFRRLRCRLSCFACRGCCLVPRSNPDSCNHAPVRRGMLHANIAGHFLALARHWWLLLLNFWRLMSGWSSFSCS